MVKTTIKWILEFLKYDICRWFSDERTPRNPKFSPSGLHSPEGLECHSLNEINHDWTGIVQGNLHRCQKLLASIEKTVGLTKAMYNKHKEKGELVILMVGGTTKFHLVQEKMKAAFKGIAQIVCTEHQLTCISRGAALYANDAKVCSVKFGNLFEHKQFDYSLMLISNKYAPIYIINKGEYKQIIHKKLHLVEEKDSFSTILVKETKEGKYLNLCNISLDLGRVYKKNDAFIIEFNINAAERIGYYSLLDLSNNVLIPRRPFFLEYPVCFQIHFWRENHIFFSMPYLNRKRNWKKPESQTEPTSTESTQKSQENSLSLVAILNNANVTIDDRKINDWKLMML